MKARRVAIVGGGIGGLTLARLLCRDGHQVSVIERAKDFSAQGHAIGFRGVGLQVMADLGLGEKVRSISRGHAGTRSFTLEGDFLRVTPNAEHARAVGGIAVTRRGPLHAILHEDLPAEIDLRFGLGPIAVEQDGEEVAVTLNDGTRLAADVLVAADGVNSAVRRLVAPEIEAIDFGGIYIGLSVAVEHGLSTNEVVSFWGKARIVSFFPLGPGEISGVIYQDDGFGPTPEGNSAASWAPYLSESLKGAATPVRRVLGALKGGDDLFHDRIRQVPPITAAIGRIAFVGDAGYCPTFFAGNGAGLAALGAWRLARALREDDDDRSALCRYQEVILPLAAGYQVNARQMRDRLFARSPLTIGLRNLTMRWGPASSVARYARRHYRGDLQLADIA